MSEELQRELVAGDQIIATKDAYFPAHIANPPKLSQRKGDIIMVNNPRVGCDIVSGTGLNGTAHNGRRCIGLGGSLRVGTFRRATPDDEGFMATRSQWHAHKDAEISRLKASLFGWRVVGIIWLGTMLMVAHGL
ncbi:hypothetical protein Gekk315_00067 [Aeromonas phage Gekk3-15]